MRKLALAAVLACAIFSIPGAAAYPRYDFNSSIDRHGLGYSMPQSWKPKIRIHQRAPKRAFVKTKAKTTTIKISRAKAVVFLPHPVGCPRVAFCGCGASQEVFKRNIRSLWLARNWYRFPASAPGPGKVAVRNHHVFVIREYLGNGMALAYDANSGNHKTRLHIRSLAGFSVRDPYGRTKIAWR